MIDEGFNTEMAVDIIEKLEDGEDIYNYLQSDEYFKNFKNQLSLMIEEKEIDKKELQKKLGRVNLNNWLNGKVVPNRANLIKICFALKCSQEESDLLISKFAGEQKLNPDDLDDAVYLFCLILDISYEDVPLYLKAKDALVEGNQELSNYDIKNKESFIKYISSKLANYESNKDKKIKVLKYVMEHPKMNMGLEYSSKGITRPIAEFMYGEKDSQKAMDRLQKMLKGKLPIRKDEFIRIIIACGYCGVEAIENSGNEVSIFSCIDEINNKLEEAGFYKLYARNQYDCIYISAAIQTVINEETSLADYLKELSVLFKERDLENYVIFDE